MEEVDGDTVLVVLVVELLVDMLDVEALKVDVLVKDVDEERVLVLEVGVEDEVLDVVDVELHIVLLQSGLACR